MVIPQQNNAVIQDEHCEKWPHSRWEEENNVHLPSLLCKHSFSHLQGMTKYETTELNIDAKKSQMSCEKHIEISMVLSLEIHLLLYLAALI
jgi:hypothetical protein